MSLTNKHFQTLPILLKTVPIETNSESHLEKHTQDNHLEGLKCDFCEFVVKNTGGLNIHIRRIPERKKYSPVIFVHILLKVSKSKNIKVQHHTFQP